MQIEEIKNSNDHISFCGSFLGPWRLCYPQQGLHCSPFSFNSNRLRIKPGHMPMIGRYGVFDFRSGWGILGSAAISFLRM